MVLFTRDMYGKAIRILAVLATLATVSVYGQDPEIVKEILPVIKRLGEEGRLSCTVTNQQNYKVYWVSGGRLDMILTADDKVHIDPSLNQEVVNGLYKFGVKKFTVGDYTTYTLMVRRLIPADAGFYTCFINVRGTTSDANPVKVGELVVIYPPSIVRSLSSHAVTADEGSNITLSCDAEGYPTPNITWIRVNGDALPPPASVVRYRGKKLHIPHVTGRYRGVYRCLADNTVRPPAKQDVTLTVRFRPYAKPVQSTYGQAQNRMFDVVIECRVQGFPEPDLQWYKKGVTGVWVAINEDDKHKVHVLLNHGNLLELYEYWFQLHIINVQGGDYGDYICEGKNRLGSNFATINLFETSECQGANCPWINVVRGGCSNIKHTFGLTFSILVSFIVWYTSQKH